MAVPSKINLLRAQHINQQTMEILPKITNIYKFKELEEQTDLTQEAVEVHEKEIKSDKPQFFQTCFTQLHLKRTCSVDSILIEQIWHKGEAEHFFRNKIFPRENSVMNDLPQKMHNLKRSLCVPNTLPEFQNLALWEKDEEAPLYVSRPEHFNGEW
ncbi:hypothetical protein LguiA_028345 [Lonicera macranthoides]